MSDTESEKSVNEENIEEIPSLTAEIIDNDDPITSNIQSGKKSKPRTEKQIAALEKARATRKANSVKNKKLKEEHTQLVEDNKEMLKKLALPQKEHYKPYPKKKPRKKIVYADDSEPSDEEIIIVKKKPPKRKPKKKIVYESSSSSEESSSEEEDNTISNDIQKYSKVHYQEEPQYEYEYVQQKPLKYSDVIKFG
tara:strand:+ start:450 stop:1034 length:585 start_codon:yes stop_codon:yes gene_type:complete